MITANLAGNAIGIQWDERYGMSAVSMRIGSATVKLAPADVFAIHSVLGLVIDYATKPSS